MYCDLVPTMIELAGGEEQKLDGRSMRKVWFEGADIHREAAFISNVHPFWQKAIVTKDYKLIWSAKPKTRHIWKNFLSKGKFFSKPWAEWCKAGAIDGPDRVKLNRVLHPTQRELYRVDTDPYETKHLASKIEQSDRVKQMHEELKKLMQQSGEDLSPPK